MRYCAERCAVELSLDELCALAHKSGHLDARYPRRSSQVIDPRALKLPNEDKREENVLLRHTLTLGGITYTVEGVAHAVCDGSLVEQIKLTKKANAGAGDSFTRLRALAYQGLQAQQSR